MVIEDWIQDTTGNGWIWYVKRLAGNDTLLSGGHQAGPYIPRQVIFDLFPSVTDRTKLNPRAKFPAIIDSHLNPEQIVTAIWYNNKVVANKTRDECRVTNWGGKTSPLLDPEATGSICVFAFNRQEGRDASGCRLWICESLVEEEVVEAITGSIEPGQWLYRSTKSQFLKQSSTASSDPCVLDQVAINSTWGDRFPTGAEIVDKVHQLLPDSIKHDPDKRLITRRNCEFTVFQSLEELFFMPKIREGFATIDEFTDHANSLLNRRKSRSGRSLELHAKAIFDEEGLTEFAHDVISEGKKRPDFLFPSQEAYQDPSFPTHKLRMLAAKTTCKDRWRQVISEADRIDVKHLLTLQEGVSLNQFKEMKESGIVLVVPAALHKKYHKEIKPELMTLSNFIADTNQLNSI